MFLINKRLSPGETHKKKAAWIALFASFFPLCFSLTYVHFQRAIHQFLLFFAYLVYPLTHHHYSQKLCCYAQQSFWWWQQSQHFFSLVIFNKVLLVYFQVYVYSKECVVCFTLQGLNIHCLYGKLVFSSWTSHIETIPVVNWSRYIITKLTTTCLESRQKDKRKRNQ